MRRKIISVASGKGGTGKTTIAVAMALALAKRGESVSLLDADVEEPNAHIFLKANPEKATTVTVPIPKVDESKCDGCGKCREACAFNAITIMAEKPLIFTELCHGCGACLMACPQKAISEVQKPIGQLDSDKVDEVLFSRGIMSVGEAMSTPIIKKLRKDNEAKTEWTIIDAPPGTSCPVISASQHADYLVLVTEPTPFGLNDLELAAGMGKALGLSCGVVINRSDLGDKKVHEFCKREKLPILLEIPFDRKIAEGYAKGKNLLESKPELADKLVDLAYQVTGGQL